MKFPACLIVLAGLSTLGACNSSNTSSAPVNASAASAPTSAARPTKIVGYSQEADAPKGYGESSGLGGGGGHQH